jgi:hypothetical protein
MLTKFLTSNPQNRVRNLKREQNLARFNFLGILNFVKGDASNKIVDLNRQPYTQKKAETLIVKTLVVCTITCYTKILRKSRSKFEKILNFENLVGKIFLTVPRKKNFTVQIKILINTKFKCCASTRKEKKIFLKRTISAERNGSIPTHKLFLPLDLLVGG